MEEELRQIALRKLLKCEMPLDSVAKDLAAHGWDYEGQPLEVSIAHVKSALQQCVEGIISPANLEQWANLIELREDLDYEHSGIIEEIILHLANPEINGEVTKQVCRDYINKISE